MPLDTLTTEYNLKSSGASKVKNDFKEVAQAANAAGVATGALSMTKKGEASFGMWDLRRGDQTSSLRKFSVALVDALPIIGSVGAAIGLAGLAVGKFGLDLIKASAATDTMARQFAVSLGSLDKGKQTMEAIESHASKSAFAVEALASASSKLIAGQVSLRRYLPTIEKFALTVSGIDPSGLDSVADAFVKARVGDFAAGINLLEKAGVSKQEFGRTAGAGFDGNKFMGSPEQFLSGLEKVVEERMSKAADLIAGGTQTALDQAGRIVARSSRQVGEELADELLPMIRNFTDDLSLLVDGGYIRILADEFRLLSDEMGGKRGGAGVIDGLAVVGLAMAKWAKDPRSMTTVSNPIASMHAFYDAMTAAAEEVGKAKIKGMLHPNELPENGTNASNRRAGPKVTVTVEKLEEHKFLLRDIAENTKPLREVMNRIIGGGAVGGPAFNAVNIQRMNSGGGSGGSKAERGMRMIIEEAMERALSQMGIARARGHYVGARGI